ncbi:hypothetical protein AQUCO_03300076v1 [Aquilegia coerulea]|uniref:Phytocyanin domain-containing protein n=1 Tax=Aquilegia coerulea TaxID=218851 RepID=A0A2G5CZE6_AQUCA|nr:hypothetical protein AQUCO_03300076v1 [Aquilegia coerulea]
MDTKMFFLVILMMGFAVFSSDAYTFFVGGKQGWVVKPSEGYDQWSSRNRFQVNDTLVFKYNKETDSVLVVNNKQDYDSCNISSPVQKLEGGDSSFKFDKSGPFYFISGNQTNCQNGQKLLIVVMSPRIKSPPPSPVAPSPSGGATPPSPAAPPPSSGGTPPTTPTGGSTPSPSGSTTPGDGGGGSSTPGAQPPASSSSPALKSSMGYTVGFSMVATLLLGSFIGFF